MFSANSIPTQRIDHVGNKHWFLNEKLHRSDGPAVIYADVGWDTHKNGGYLLIDFG